MTSNFLHAPGSWVSIGPSERRALIDERGELALLPESVAPLVFDDRILGATGGGCRARSAAYKAAAVTGRTGRIRSNSHVVSLERVASPRTAVLNKK
jgi:hypothetical protein